MALSMPRVAQQKTPEQIAEQRVRSREACRRYRARRTDEQKEAVKAYLRTYRQENKEYFRRKAQEYRHANPIQRLIKATRQSAIKRGLTHTITARDLEPMPSHCPVLGLELCFTNTTTSMNSPSIDRIDNAKGYTPDNVIVVSYKANLIKNCATVAELGAVYSFYRGLRL